MSKSRKRLALAGIGLLLLGASAWLALPRLVEVLLPGQLARFGIPEASINITRIGFEQAMIDHFSFHYPGDTEIKGEVEGIILEYHPSALIGKGRLAAVKAESMTIDLYENQDSRKNVDPFDLDWLTALLQQPLPLNSATIKQGLIRRHTASGLREMRVDAVIDHRDGEIGARIGLTDAAGARREARLKKQASGGLQVAFTPTPEFETQPLILNVLPKKHAFGIEYNGRLQVDFAALTAWLGDLVTAETATRIQGSVDARITLLPRGETTRFDIELTGRSMDVFGIQAEEMTLALGGTAREMDNAWSLTLHTARAELQKVSRHETEVEAMQIEAGGAMEIAPAGFNFSWPVGWTARLQNVQDPVLALDQADLQGRGPLDIQGEPFELVTAQSVEIALVQAKGQSFAWQRAETQALIGFSINEVTSELKLDHANLQVTGLTYPSGQADEINGGLAGSLLQKANRIDGHLRIDEGFQARNVTLAETRIGSVSGAGQVNLEQRNNREKIELSDALYVELDKVTGDDFTVGRSRMVLDGIYERDGTKQVITLRPGSKAGLTDVVFDTLTVPQISLTPGREPLLLENTDNQWINRLGQVRIQEIDGAVDDVRFFVASPRLSAFQFIPGDQAWQISSDFDALELGVAAEDVSIVFNELQSHFTIDPREVAMAGGFMLSKMGAETRFHLRHRFDAGEGKFTFQSTPVNFGQQGITLKHLLQTWPWDFDFVTGSVEVKGEARWSPAASTVEITPVMSNIGGLYEEVAFSGLDAAPVLSLWPRLQTLHSAPIKVRHLDYGVSLSDLEFDLTLNSTPEQDWPRLTLGDFSAEIFGGQLESRRIDYDPNALENALALRLHDIDLEQIVSLHGFEDLEASGRLNGVLPLKIGAAGVSMDEGSIRAADEGGVIQYRPAGGAGVLEQSAPGMEIVFQVLRNFHYNALDTSVKYEPNGALTMEIKLQGTSPEIESKRPVHLNINLQQNVLSLLKSMRLVGGINEAVNERVRQHYEKSLSR